MPGHHAEERHQDPQSDQHVHDREDLRWGPSWCQVPVPDRGELGVGESPAHGCEEAPEGGEERDHVRNRTLVVMPELPEVETTRRGLEPYLKGRRIVAAEARRPRMLRRQPRERDFADRLQGRTVRELRRTGKFIFIDLDGDLTWVIHLGMSGRMQVADHGEPEVPHTNVVVRTGAKEIRFVDPRTFGFMAVLTPEEYDDSPLAGLGPDALTDLPPSRHIAARLAGRKPAIKSLLMDQRLLAGLGNIYADEVLFRARVAPHREAGSLTGSEVASIRRAIGPVLRAGLKHGGTSLNDLAYLLPDGRAGDYLARLAVYGREGEPCRRCGAPVRRSLIGQRSSHWCPTCQT